MPALCLKLLGPFDCRDADGTSVDLPTRRAEALLAYLGVHAYREQPREILATLLWADKTEAQARANLRQTLSRLRRSLPEAAANCVVADPARVSLSRATTEIDVVVFERLARSSAPDELERAAAISRGLLLEGFAGCGPAFQEWLSAERRHFEELTRGVLERLLTRHLDSGTEERAIQIALRLLALDPLQEGIHRTLMRLYFQQDRIGAAAQQYEICREVLATELGVAPAPETQRLHTKLLRQLPVDRTVTGATPTLREDRLHESRGRSHSELFARPAIAVLPFTNLSGDPEQEYFSDGLSEDIIALLSAWRSFPVVARHSSFAFKNTRGDVRQIARDLSARYIIEGSVRRSGKRIRVSAQLVDAETGHQLWTEKFDGKLDDVFEIQDEVTRRIVSAVEPEMEKAERYLAATKRAASLTAWDQYLQGRELLHKVTPTDNARARAKFEEAIKSDLFYSDAYAGLSYTYQMDILLEVCPDRADWKEKALEIARKAVSLDKLSSIAHFALSGAYIWRNQHKLAIAETRKAVELNPSNRHAWLALGNRLDIIGQSDEGIPLLERSLRQYPGDPHSHIYYAQLARAYINTREYERALDCLNESILCQPNYPHTYHVLAICLGHLGRFEEARAAASRCNELHPGFIERRADWDIYVNPAANQHLADGLRKAGLVK